MLQQLHRCCRSRRTWSRLRQTQEPCASVLPCRGACATCSGGKLVQPRPGSLAVLQRASCAQSSAKRQDPSKAYNALRTCPIDSRTRCVSGRCVWASHALYKAVHPGCLAAGHLHSIAVYIRAIQFDECISVMVGVACSRAGACCAAMRKRRPGLARASRREPIRQRPRRGAIGRDGTDARPALPCGSGRALQSPSSGACHPGARGRCEAKQAPSSCHAGHNVCQLVSSACKHSRRLARATCGQRHAAGTEVGCAPGSRHLRAPAWWRAPSVTCNRRLYMRVC